MSPISVLPTASESATYVVAENYNDVANNTATNNSETITLTARADGSFNALVAGTGFSRTVIVRPWPGGALDTNGARVGTTFWAQDLNAVVSLLTGRGASLTDAATWTTQPIADANGIYVPDMSRQNGTTWLLVPMSVHVARKGTSWRVDATSTGDSGNNPVSIMRAYVLTSAIFSNTGRLVHAEGSIKYGLPASATHAGEVLPIFTRSWTIEPKV